MSALIRDAERAIYDLDVEASTLGGSVAATVLLFDAFDIALFFVTSSSILGISSGIRNGFDTTSSCFN